MGGVGRVITAELCVPSPCGFFDGFWLVSRKLFRGLTVSIGLSGLVVMKDG